MAGKKEKANNKKNKTNNKEVEIEINKDNVETTQVESEQKVDSGNQKNDETIEVKESMEEVDYEKKYNELNDKYLRLSAEFDNFRRRNLKEKMELIKTAGEDILLNILPVIDNFERALKSMNTGDSEGTNAIKEGVELIYNNFKEFLAQRGVKEIEAVGKDFDTDLHEAISKIPAPQEEFKGKVIDVIEKGYLMHEKVIRFAKVVVGE